MIDGSHVRLNSDVISKKKKKTKNSNWKKNSQIIQGRHYTEKIYSIKPSMLLHNRNDIFRMEIS